MAFNLQQQLMQLSVPGPTAKELANQINSGVYSAQRLIWAGIPQALSFYLAESLSASNYDPNRAVELGMIPAVAVLVKGPDDAFLFDFWSDEFIINDEPSSVGALTYLRTGGDLYVRDSAGDFHVFTDDELPYTDLGVVIETAGENHIRNVLVTGTASDIPTNWSESGNLSGTGITRTFSRATINGVPCLVLALAGTASSNNGYSLRFESNTQIVVAQGETWTNSGFFAVTSGSITGINQIRLAVREGTDAGVIVGSETFGSDIKAFLSDDLERFSFPHAIAGATATRANPGINFGWLNGAIIDISVAIALPQMEERALASVPKIGATGATSLTLPLPTGAPRDLQLTFDDDSSQSISDVPGGNYVIDPATLDRPQVKVIDWRSV